MSQFNSIFSPLTNKLARLAGITLLAVAALFASTQQVAAQTPGTVTCVTSLEVRVGVGCAAVVTPSMVVLGSTAGLTVKINDLNPTNGGDVDGISPASGWVYGVYNGTTLICTGVIYAVDYTAPAITAPGAVEFWCDDVNSVYNQTASWNTPNSKYFAGNLTENVAGTDAVVTATDNCGSPIQIKVTDRIDYTECTGAASSATGTIFATVTRSFTAIDQRGNDTTVTQTITFKRPNIIGAAGPAYAGGTGYNTINGITVDSTNRVAGGGTYLAQSAAGTNMIIFSACAAPSGTAAEVKAELRKYLRSLYRVGYALPNEVRATGVTSGIGTVLGTDTAFIFDAFCNYSVDFTYTEFPNCNNGKKFMITTTFADWCPGGATTTDDVVISFEDTRAPVFAAERTDVGGILGATSGTPVVVSVGTNDCTASLRLGTAANMRDLSTLFNLKVTDNCSALTGINLNYVFETSNYWNGSFYVAQGFTQTNYTVVNTSNGPLVMGLPIGVHKVTITANDLCNYQATQVLYFNVQDKVAPVMKCDDNINVSLTSNASSNYFINLNNSDIDLTKQMQARLYVADINEGSRDNCTLDSLYVRRQFHKDCLPYYAMNMDYDIYGNNSNGTVTLADFDRVGTSDFYYTPKFMQYVDFFCCDGNEVMVELWGSDAQHYNVGATPTTMPRASANWSFCMTTVTITDATSPSITRPNLAATYNSKAENWIHCTDKEWLQGPDLPRTLITTLAVNNNTDNTVNGKVATVKAANDYFGIPDIYGVECSGDVYYEVKKKLTCDTGVILRIWDVVKNVKGVTVSVKDTQLIWVQASHDYTITVPADVTTDCPNLASVAGAPSWNENGCDLLAISAVNETVYNAAAADNACKKIYRTWTVINWCQVPNQFSCSSADPMNYARIIPRLTTRTGSGTATSPWVYTAASTTLPAVSQTHRFTKSNADKTRDKGQGSLIYAQWLGTTLPAATGANVSALALSGAGAMGTQRNSTSWAGQTIANYLASDVPSTTCNSFGERTFAWSYTQVVKIQDSSKPTIDTDETTGLKFKHADAGASDDVNWNAAKKVFGIRGNAPESPVASTNGTECQALVKFTFDVSDGCAASGPFNVEAGAYIVKKTSPLSTTSEGKTVTVTPADPTQANKTFAVSVDGLGIDATTGKQDYQLVVSVRDDCGNVTTDRIDFTVADIKAPAPVCVQNLTVTLMPTNAGGSPNAGMTVIKAIDVFQDINRNWGDEECTPTVKAKIVRTSLDTATVAATINAYKDTIIATCNDRGGIAARVYLIDGAGNYNYCSITIAVEDNASICGATGSAAVAGAIQTESKATVEGVQVNLSGQTQKSFATGVNGLFVFNNLTAGADYTVTPSLNKGFLNGVSTFDLVLISKHILGVQPLNTPYKLIAADVNNSKSVTTLDLIQLRKLILNIDATFANNSSWRFVDASYTFPNASNPWAASFPEVKNVNDLEGSLSANFVAVKVGDVNGNAIANSTQGSVRNLTSNLGINVADMNMVAGNEYKVDFTAADLNGIEGFQFTLNLDKKGLELVDLVPGIAAEENFGIFAEEGVVTASWNGEAKGGVLFSLVVRAKSNTTLSEVLNLNSRYTTAEAYKGGEVVNVGLNFNASKASANYELYQNTPNPFAGESIIGFNLPAAGAATLTIQDVTGRTLKVINGQYAKGYNQVSLKSTELSATGVLTYTLKAADFTATRKMIIVE
jgi:large repetitive protein